MNDYDKMVEIWEVEGLRLKQDRINEICGDLQVKVSQYWKFLREYKKSIGIEVKEEESDPDKIFANYIESVRKKALGDKDWARIYTGLLRFTKIEEINDELSPEQYLEFSRKLRDTLSEEYKSTGICPLCQFRVLLDSESRIHPEREHNESGEVATVGLPD